VSDLTFDEFVSDCKDAINDAVRHQAGEFNENVLHEIVIGATEMPTMDSDRRSVIESSADEPLLVLATRCTDQGASIGYEGDVLAAIWHFDTSDKVHNAVWPYAEALMKANNELYNLPKETEDGISFTDTMRLLEWIDEQPELGGYLTIKIELDIPGIVDELLIGATDETDAEMLEDWALEHPYPEPEEKPKEETPPTTPPQVEYLDGD
jgi:hypothetical protein